MKARKKIAVWLIVLFATYYLLSFSHWIGAPFGSDFLISETGFYFLALFALIEVVFVTF